MLSRLTEDLPDLPSWIAAATCGNRLLYLSKSCLRNLETTRSCTECYTAGGTHTFESKICNIWTCCCHLNSVRGLFNNSHRMGESTSCWRISLRIRRIAIILSIIASIAPIAVPIAEVLGIPLAGVPVINKMTPIVYYQLYDSSVCNKGNYHIIP